MKVTNDMINPQLRRTGMLVRRLLTFENEKTFARAQSILARVRGVIKSKKLQAVQHMVQTSDNPELRVCVYKGLTPRPGAVGLLWIHGGGYGLGIPEQDLGFIEKFVQATNCVVVSPDYRLSIDAPYPAAANDCDHALLWMQKHAEELGIDDSRLFVGGESAGGGLTAAVTLMARDTKEVNVAYQMPFYPMLDDRMITPSAQNNDAPVWNSKANKLAWQMYLGNLYGTKQVPAYAAPARAQNYAGLPPTYTYVGSIEPFCDETKQYIQNLQQAGVPAEIDVYPGCFHGFDIMCGKSKIAQKATQKYIQRFKEAAQNYSAPQPGQNKI